MNNIHINEKAKAMVETLSNILSEKKLIDILILVMLVLCTFLSIDAIIVSIRSLFSSTSLSSITLSVLPWMILSLSALLFLRHWINK